MGRKGRFRRREAAKRPGPFSPRIMPAPPGMRPGPAGASRRGSAPGKPRRRAGREGRAAEREGKPGAALSIDGGGSRRIISQNHFSQKKSIHVLSARFGPKWSERGGVMIRNLRTRRDNQQWILDLALNMRGRVQNFEKDELEVPKRAHNYRMLPKMWREEGGHQEALGKRAQANGYKMTAFQHYDLAIEAYRMAQHPIFYDDHPVKLATYKKLSEMVDRRAECAPYPIERVEVPFDDGKTISCLFYKQPDGRRAPTVIYVPGMDQTKEAYPKAYANHAIQRGMNIISIDGPGQGNSNIQKIRAVGDNYERAGAAVIDYLLGREEVEPSQIGIYGISMGSFWSLRLSSYDHRMAAVASAVACFNPNNTIFTESSPRFKQVFMYMAGMDDEDEFDEMAKTMTVKGYMDKIQCPTLLITGEFDPLCPLEDAIEVYHDIKAPKEMWVFENQFHPLWKLSNVGDLDCHQYAMDWLSRALAGEGVPAGHDRIAYLKEHGDGPYGDCEWKPTVGPGEAYF